MMLRIGPAGSVGIIKDVSQHELRNEAWTDGRNVRFLDGSAIQFFGHGEVYAGAPIVPYHLMPVNVGSERHWLYAGAAKIYDVTSASGTPVHTNLTRQEDDADVDYTGAPNAWTSTSLSGIPILNPGNEVDPPQRWNLDTDSRLQALDNWPEDTFCKSLRAYKNQLVALNVTKAGVNFPFMVKWSHPAAPGSVPASWDETDLTKDAGEVDLAEGGDPVMDGLQLGGTFVVYKEQSIWRMDYVGGSFVNSFTKVLGTSGAMNRNCIVEIDGFHVVLTGSDVLVHDGQSANSVLDKQARRALFQSIDAQNTGRCFVFKNPYLNEVFVCFPEVGATIPNKALVWNYKDRTVAFRDLPSIHHANYGPVEQGISQPWDGDASPWLSDVTSWNVGEFSPDTVRVLMASDQQKLFLLDSSTTFDGTLPTAFIERRGLSLGNHELRKFVRGVWPVVRGNPGETIKISVGYAEDPESDPTYSQPQTFRIGIDQKCDFGVDGRYIALKVEGDTAYQWWLDSFRIDYELSGAF